MISRCFLVVVSTPDIDSAYRIFSVLNNRGMDLSHADILKAEVIGKISAEEQDNYSEKWESSEEKLGRETFKSLFSHIRMIHGKAKPRESILKEFVHRIGNLVLLSSCTNRAAQNYDFELKKQKYFTTKKGVSNFALTTQVLMEQEWTPEVIDKRQEQLIEKLKEIWRLGLFESGRTVHPYRCTSLG